MCCWLTDVATVHPIRLDYPGIGPEHSFLKDVGRAEYYAVTDAEALEAFQLLSQLEGIIPALETSHAFAYLEVCRTLLLLYCPVYVMLQRYILIQGNHVHAECIC